MSQKNFVDLLHRFTIWLPYIFKHGASFFSVAKCELTGGDPLVLRSHPPPSKLPRGDCRKIQKQVMSFWAPRSRARRWFENDQRKNSGVSWLWWMKAFPTFEWDTYDHTCTVCLRQCYAKTRHNSPRIVEFRLVKESTLPGMLML